VQDFRNYTDSRRQGTVENFYKELRTKMTFEATMAKRDEHLQFNKCVMTVWDMLHYLDQVVDESDPDTNLTQIQHAIQTGESARALYPGPEYDWFHLTGLIHDLGKILAVNDKSKGLTGEPQWCVVGDTFPVGCQFNETNIFYKYYENNPDSKNKTYNTFYGIYEPKCGLSNVYMSWGHDEYMYQIAKSQSTLPEEGLYMLRFHSFYPWHNKHGYMHLCNDKDLELLKWVKAFQKCDLYSKSHECPTLADVASYYKPIIEKYFPNPVRW
jgi:inositol oxygenase